MHSARRLTPAVASRIARYITRSTPRLVACWRVSLCGGGIPMYAHTARFRRAIFAGSPLHLMLALICTCAITLGGTSVASAGALYDSVTHSQKHHHGHANSNAPNATTPA